PASALVPRYLRRGVPGRLSSKGDELTPIDMNTVRRQIDHFVEHEVEAVAVCLLHSYANPGHEQQIADYIRKEYPNMSVSTSNELVREWREYERTSTTVIN